MLRQRVFVTAAFAATLLVHGPAPAVVLAGGGGHGGGGGHAGGHPGGCYGGHYGYYRHGYGYGYGGYGYGPWWGVGINIDLTSGYYYGPGPYAVGYPVPVAVPVPASDNPSPALSPPAPLAPPEMAPPPKPVDDTAAHFTVSVPADAEVWLNDQHMTQGGTERRYRSTPLSTEKDYRYEVRARWLENGNPVERTRTVTFRAGENLNVNFLAPDPKGDESSRVNTAQ